MAYAVRRIKADRPRRLKLLAGSDDAIRIWLDGKPILDVLELRPPAPDQDVAALDLPAGESILVVELAQAWSYWGFYLRFEDEQGRKLRLTAEGELRPLE